MLKRKTGVKIVERVPTETRCRSASHRFCETSRFYREKKRREKNSSVADSSSELSAIGCSNGVAKHLD